MKTQTVLLAVALAALPASVGASNPLTDGALPVPANRIVGLWTTVGKVAPCDSPAAPTITITNTLLFNAGGTLVENSGLSNPNGQGRTWGLGTWRYDPRTRRYTMFLRFNHYLNGVYTGFATVDRELVLSNNDTVANGLVVSTRYDTAGEQISQLCGSAMSTRL